MLRVVWRSSLLAIRLPSVPVFSYIFFVMSIMCISIVLSVATIRGSSRACITTAAAALILPKRGLRVPSSTLQLSTNKCTTIGTLLFDYSVSFYSYYSFQGTYPAILIPDVKPHEY